MKTADKPVQRDTSVLGTQQLQCPERDQKPPASHCKHISV